MSIDTPRPWLASYAPGVPHEIELPSGSLYDLLETSVSAYSEHVALEFFGTTTSYRELGDQVLRAAQGLRALGVRRGDAVAIVLPNAPLVASGPYRFLRHPNYAVVAGEIAVLPLMLHLPRLAVLFTMLNAAVLFVRIRAEDRALQLSRGLAAQETP